MVWGKCGLYVKCKGSTISMSYKQRRRILSTWLTSSLPSKTCFLGSYIIKTNVQTWVCCVFCETLSPRGKSDLEMQRACGRYLTHITRSKWKRGEKTMYSIRSAILLVSTECSILRFEKINTLKLKI